MVLGLYSLLEAGLLVVNAIVILHEERFLNKSKLSPSFSSMFKFLTAFCFVYSVGWGRNHMMIADQNPAPYDFYGQQPQPGAQSTKFQIMNLIHSIRTVARIPLIAINIIVIIVKLVFG